MTDRYAKLATHARTSNTAREMWKLFERAAPKAKIRQTMFAYCSREKFYTRFGYR
jgi:hypothetical protein